MDYDGKIISFGLKMWIYQESFRFHEHSSHISAPSRKTIYFNAWIYSGATFLRYNQQAHSPSFSPGDYGSDASFIRNAWAENTEDTEYVQNVQVIFWLLVISQVVMKILRSCVHSCTISRNRDALNCFSWTNLVVMRRRDFVPHSARGIWSLPKHTQLFTFNRVVYWIKH